MVLCAALSAAPSSAQPASAVPPVQADTTTADRSPEPPRSRDLAGWVVDAETGWPLSRAVVLVESAARPVRVDAMGRFRLRASATRPTVVTVACPGYAPVRVPLRAEQSRAVFHLVRSSSTRTTWPVTFVAPDR